MLSLSLSLFLSLSGNAAVRLDTRPLTRRLDPEINLTAELSDRGGTALTTRYSRGTSETRPEMKHTVER